MATSLAQIGKYHSAHNSRATTFLKRSKARLVRRDVRKLEHAIVHLADVPDMICDYNTNRRYNGYSD